MTPKVEKQLNEIISLNLWSPSGDPSFDQLKSAAYAVLVLGALGLKVEGEEDVLQALREEKLICKILDGQNG